MPGNRQGAVLLLTAISIGHCSVAIADNTESRSLPDFSGISVRGAVPVSLQQGNERRAYITTADHVTTSSIVTSVDHGLLTVQLAPGAYTNPRIQVVVSHGSLKKINAEAGASVRTIQPVASDLVEVNAASGARLHIELDAREVVANTDGGARLNLSGRTHSLIASSTSGSTLTATQLSVEVAKGSSSSGGRIQVHTDGHLVANATSGGTVTYSGSPSRFEQHATRGGRILKQNPQ